MVFKSKSTSGPIWGSVRKYTAVGVLLSMIHGGALAEPSCRTAFEEPEFAFAAGCLVKNGNRMLLVRHRYNGKLGFPAGFADPGESAQCTAHRETWEETGLDVVVHGLIERLSTGLALYRCELTDAAAAGSDELVVPRSGRGEIARVLWLDPRSTQAPDWRFPRDYPVILDLFNQAE